MTDKDIPRAVYENVVKVGGMELKVVVLEDGQRLIEKESLERFFAAMEAGVFSEDEVRKVVRVVGREIKEGI